jgi:hypothetical protein
MADAPPALILPDFRMFFIRLTFIVGDEPAFYYALKIALNLQMEAATRLVRTLK